MSIHKSKGLEFPVVFILKGEGEFYTKDWNGKFILHKDYGIGCDFVDVDKRIKYPLISKEAISYKLMLEGLSEEMRVLYVALTRAREKLFFVVLDKKAKEKIETRYEKEGLGSDSLYDVQKASGFFDWIVLSLTGNKEKCCWEINEITPAELVLPENKLTEGKNVKVTDEEKCEIERRLFYTYPYAKSTELSSKYSVTELKNRFNSQTEEDGNVYRYREELLPAFMKGEKLSAAEKGTVLHLILKFVDISAENHEEAIEKCRNYLLSEKFISQKEIDGVDLSVIKNFMQSDVCREMKNADVMHRELSFNICVGGDVPTGDSDLKNDTVLLQGIIDCLYIKDGKFYILDYKTDGGKQTEDELINQYRPQLELYRIAAEKITGCEFGGAYLYFLNRGVLRSIDK